MGAVKLRLRLADASRDAELTDLFGSYREAGASDFLFEVACRDREYAFDAVQRVMGCFKQLK